MIQIQPFLLFTLFMASGHFGKLFVKNTRKKVPAGKNFGAFSPRYS